MPILLNSVVNVVETIPASLQEQIHVGPHLLNSRDDFANLSRVPVLDALHHCDSVTYGRDVALEGGQCLVDMPQFFRIILIVGLAPQLESLNVSLQFGHLTVTHCIRWARSPPVIRLPVGKHVPRVCNNI